MQHGNTYLSSDGSPVMAQVVKKDIVASNGIIHILARMLENKPKIVGNLMVCTKFFKLFVGKYWFCCYAMSVEFAKSIRTCVNYFQN